MENQDWSHRHATWEVNAFLMLPTGCCRSYNTQSARLHQQLNAFLMSTLPTMVQFVILLQYPKWWKPDCTSMQLLRKCTRSAHWLHSRTDHRRGPSRFHFWTKLKPSSVSTPPPFIYGPTLSTIKLWECERQVPGNNFIAGSACHHFANSTIAEPSRAKYKSLFTRQRCHSSNHDSDKHLSKVVTRLSRVSVQQKHLIYWDTFQPKSASAWVVIYGYL